MERFKFDNNRELSNKEITTLHAKEALKLATWDGSPYYYKVAYDEAIEMLKRLNV